VPYSIDEASILPCRQSLGLRWCVTHHTQQRLVAPHIVLQRRDVQIAHEDATDEVQPVAVFHTLRAVGDVAASHAGRPGMQSQPGTGA
jgi:hypothetical protein